MEFASTDRICLENCCLDDRRQISDTRPLLSLNTSSVCPLWFRGPTNCAPGRIYVRPDRGRATQLRTPHACAVTPAPRSGWSRSRARPADSVRRAQVGEWQTPQRTSSCARSGPSGGPAPHAQPGEDGRDVMVHGLGRSFANATADRWASQRGVRASRSGGPVEADSAWVSRAAVSSAVRYCGPPGTECARGSKGS